MTEDLQMSTITPTAQKIIVAGLTTSNPSAIATATGLALITVYGGIKNLEKQNLAVFDKENKVLTLTEEGQATAQAYVAPEEPKVEEVKVEEVEKTFTVRTGTNKAIAWEVIEQMQAEGKRRKEIQAHLAELFNIKLNAASQYIQHHRKAHGLVGVKKAKTGTDDDVSVGTYPANAPTDADENGDQK